MRDLRSAIPCSEIEKIFVILTKRHANIEANRARAFRADEMPHSQGHLRRAAQNVFDARCRHELAGTQCHIIRTENILANIAPDGIKVRMIMRKIDKGRSIEQIHRIEKEYPLAIARARNIDARVAAFSGRHGASRIPYGHDLQSLKRTLPMRPGDRKSTRLNSSH